MDNIRPPMSVSVNDRPALIPLQLLRHSALSPLHRHTLITPEMQEPEPDPLSDGSSEYNVKVDENDKLGTTYKVTQGQDTAMSDFNGEILPITTRSTARTSARTTTDANILQHDCCVDDLSEEEKSGV